MSLSRRAFVKTLGVGGASAAVLARAPKAWARPWWTSPAPETPILLHNNENPMGPGEAVIDAMRTVLGGGGSAGRYPFDTARGLTETIAKKFGVPAENVMIGNGSTQLLRTATQVFTSPTKPLVQGSLTYEECAGYAEVVGHKVVKVPLNDELMLDLDAMAEASKGAGMFFLNNPNNPTATVYSGDAVRACIDRVLSGSPDTMILVDEAYHDYVTDPSYKSQFKLAVKNKRVIVARTFSKAHGMAGMRIGYIFGHEDTIQTMRRWHYGNSLNVLALAGASVSIRDADRIEAERARNTGARDYTLDWFRSRGYKGTDSMTNFLFVETGMPARKFREACLENGIKVGRDFPPFENTHARISIGTMEEMRYATDVFGKVLGAKTAAAAA